MAFNTLTFALYFGIFNILYRLIPETPVRGRNLLLLAASYAFYGSWDWRFAGLLAFSTVVNFAIGLEMGEDRTPQHRKTMLVLALAFNLGLLGFFKYFNFFADGLAALLGSSTYSPALNIVLPLGISFYTFQVLSYPIDIRRGVIRPTRDFLDFSLFVAFFPNIVAGPIERARNLLPQIASRRPISAERFHEGAWLIFWGLFKKIVVADNLSKFTTPIFDLPVSSSGLQLLTAFYAFAIQIYADFSGYSDMARGLAKWMGFELMLNFKTPFFSPNLPVLWQRWHMSLTNWIKEYVFYPLALWRPRGRSLESALVILITWVLMGIWHGPTLVFAIWGFYHAALLVLYNRLLPHLNRVRPKQGWRLTTWNAGSVLITFHFFAIGLLCFAVKLPEEVLLVFDGIIQWQAPYYGGTFSLQPFYLLVFLVLPLVVVESAQARADDEFVVFRWPVWAKTGFYYLGFYLIVLYGVFSANRYFYDQF